MNATSILMTILPGPDRKRTGSLYHYHLSYRNPDPDAVGCVSTWAVSGGRMAYQIALERDERDRLRFHCTCADAVYRGEDDPFHVCKHVRGLLDFVPPVPQIHHRTPDVRKSA